MKTLKFFLGTSLVVLMLLSASQTFASQGISYAEQNKLVTISVDNLTIMVNAGGQIPKFHYQVDNGLSFNVMFKLMAEYYDFNDDGAFQYNETNIWGSEPPGIGEVRYNTIFSMSSVVWAFSGFEVEESEGVAVAIHFNFTSTDILDPNYAGLELAIVAHFYLDNQVIDGYEIAGGRELKFDLIVKNWPWQKDDTNLAIRFDISTDNADDNLEQEHGKPIDLGSNTTGMEQKAKHTPGEMKQNVTIEHDGSIGYFAYSNQSQNMINNKYQTMVVNASYSSDGNNNVQYYLCFEHFDDEFRYDPSVGSIETGSTEDMGDTTSLGSPSLLFLSFGTLIVLSIYLYRKKK